MINVMKRCFLCNKLMMAFRKAVVSIKTKDGEFSYTLCKKCELELDRIRQERAYESV